MPQQIPAIFVETSVPVRNIEALQAAVRDRGFDVEIGGQLYSDSLGDPAGTDGTFIGMVPQISTRLFTPLQESNHEEARSRNITVQHAAWRSTT